MILQIGVKVLIHRTDDMYLFMKRTDVLQNETEESWDIPGGRINAEESLASALAREVSEEIGVTIDNEPQLINAQDIFVPAKDLHVVRLTYIVDSEPFDITLSDEHQEYAWLSLKDAHAIAIEPYLKETLEKFLS